MIYFFHDDGREKRLLLKASVKRNLSRSYLTMKKKILTRIEKYVLVRYLDLRIINIIISISGFLIVKFK